MKYRIRILKRALKDIAAIPERDRRRVISAIDDLAATPRPDGVKALKGKYKGYSRVRVGNYRILYEIRDKQLVVIVVRIPNRREAYD